MELASSVASLVI